MSYHLDENPGKNAYVLRGMSGNCCYELWFYDVAHRIRHRLDGPAIIKSELSLPGDEEDAYQEWWYMGTQIVCATQEEFEKLLKLKAFW